MAPAPLLPVAPLVHSTSVAPLVHSTSNVAMDAALAARETAQLVYFNANSRSFIFLIQEGDSQNDRIERFNTTLGVDSRGSILKLEEVRQAMASILQSSSHRFLVGLSFYIMKLSAFCKGGVGLETGVMDSLDIFLLQDFVISKASSASINGVPIMEKFDMIIF